MASIFGITVAFENGTQKNIVIGHDKLGNFIAMDVLKEKEIWWKNAEKQYNTNADPLPAGSGMVRPCGIFNYHVVDDSNNTLYITSTNSGYNYFTCK